MTLFSAILGRLGLSQSQAASYLGVRLDTVKSWSSGRRNVPDYAFDRLRELEDAVQDATQEAYRIWQAMEFVPQAKINAIASRSSLPDGCRSAIAAGLWAAIQQP